MQTPEQDNLDNEIFGTPVTTGVAGRPELMVPISTVIDWVIGQDGETDDDTPQLVDRPSDVFTPEAEIIQRAAEAGRLLGRREVVEAAIVGIARLAENDNK